MGNRATAVVTLELKARGRRSRLDTTLKLGSGLVTLLGDDPGALAELVEITTGLARGRRSRVTLDGMSPYATPELRRRVGALPRDGVLVDRGTVAASLACIDVWRQSPGAATTALEALGCGRVLTRAVRGLAEAERRVVRLAVAVSTPEPLLLALYEPLAVGGHADPALVLGALTRAAAAGAVVLSCTASVAMAASLGGAHLLSSQGRMSWYFPRGGLAELGHGSPGALLVESSERDRLTAVLAEHSSGLQILTLDDPLGRWAVVIGPSLDVAAEAVLDASIASGAPIGCIQAAGPDASTIQRLPALTQSSHAVAPAAAPEVTG